MISMSHRAPIIMKVPSNFEAVRRPFKTMEKNSAAAAVEFNVSHPKTSPLKEHVPVKPSVSPVGVTTVLFSLNNTTRAVHNKENNNGKEHDRNSEELPLGNGGLEDSGYLSLHNSHIDDHRDDHEEEGEEQSVATPSHPTCQEKTIALTQSPLKTDPKTASAHSKSLGTFTPTKYHGKTASERTVSSTPAQHSNPNLPILRFQQAVCEELAKGFQRTQRYDWSVVGKLAEDYVLDRVIGRQMGLEYVDVFASLLSRNMRGVLTFILAQLGDMDLISCKKVSRVWRRIICEDKAALSRCQQAEQRLHELRHTRGQSACGLTRDVTLSRVVLSCMQTLASSTPSSSTPCSRASRRVPSSQKDGAHPLPTRFQEYLDAASGLKQHESLCRCKRCGSPAKNLAAAQRATCTRSSCLFDFCTRCQEAFHGSAPCRTLQTRSSRSTLLIGSARSKRNVRRL